MTAEQAKTWYDLCFLGNAKTHPHFGFDEHLGEDPFSSRHMRIMRTKMMQEMPAGSYLVNTACGGLINESDLAAALRSGQIKAAALDVTEFEPHDGYPASSSLFVILI